MKEERATTTYILVGGNEFADPVFGSNLSREVRQMAPCPRLLNCYFATEKSRWPEKQEQMQEWCDKNFPEVKDSQIALPDVFFDQISQSDVIYLHGGDTVRLIEALRALGIGRQTFQGKIVIGSSAGANALTTNAWSSLTQKPRKGMGLVNLNVMVHYGAPLVGEIRRTMEDWKKEEQQFRELVVGEEPIIHLSEGKFIVVSS